MMDLETTGTDPARHACIQLAAVRFNYAKQTVGDSFVGYMTIPYSRGWDEGTRDWWMSDGKAELCMSILAQGQDPGGVMRAFSDWAWQAGPEQRLWAKPISFEWPFLQSYALQFGVTLPFHYRDAIDLNSFCRGMANNPGAKPIEKDIPFEGTEHDAIDDVLHQIKAALLARVLIA